MPAAILVPNILVVALMAWLLVDSWGARRAERRDLAELSELPHYLGDHRQEVAGEQPA